MTRHRQFLALVPCVCNIYCTWDFPIPNTHIGRVIDYESSYQALRLWQTHLRLQPFRWRGSRHRRFPHTLHLRNFLHFGHRCDETCHVGHSSSYSALIVKLSNKFLLSSRLAFYRRIFPIAELKVILIAITTAVFLYTVAFTTLIIAQW